MKVTYTIREAGQATGLSPDTLRRAVAKTVDDREFPPPLRGAKRAGSRILIPAAALVAWVEGLPDL